jgi:hypothetical protein
MLLPVRVHLIGRHAAHHIRLCINLAGVERQKSRHRDPRVAAFLFRLSQTGEVKEIRSS